VAPTCDLPDDCWRVVASFLATSDLCALSCCSTTIRAALHHSLVWAGTHCVLFGRPPDAALGVDAIKLTCRVSELEAWDWFGTSAAHATVGMGWG